VLNQSYQPDEIIVVDDGSTDNSKEIVEKFQNIILIKQKNCGETCARNRGIKEAKNEYICFLDADDLWEKEFLQEIKLLISTFTEATFFSTAHDMIDENGTRIKAKSLNNFFGVINNFFKTFNNYYGLINSSSVCIRKSSNILFPAGEKKGEDICVWMELALNGKLAHSSKALSVYKLDASNRSGSIHKDIIIPCQLKWIYQNRKRATKDIINFVHKNILITCYANDREFTKSVIKFMKKNGDLFWIFLIFKFILPDTFIRRVRDFRRKYK
jgi:glycosyltransferase involved in cell wall biosynthesis